MTDVIETARGFIESLQGIQDWGEHCRQIEGWAASGNVDLLLEIALLLESPHSGAATALVREAIFDNIEETLALTKDLRCAALLLKLAALPRRISSERMRSRYGVWRQAYIASLLASGQALETLIPLFKRDLYALEELDVLVDLSQEMVVRGLPVVDTTVSQFYETYAVAVSHRLAWLPLTLSSNEAELSEYLPERDFHGSSCYLPFRSFLLEEQPAIPQLAELTDVAAVEIIDPMTMSLEAVANWVDESNGRAESRRYFLNFPIEPEELHIDTLVALGLECLHETAKENISLRHASLGKVLNNLFSAASHGGAYNDGCFAGFGRLAAWRSIAGLIGVSEEATFQEVTSLAEQCKWFSFVAVNEWFYQSAWDLGIAVLWPDGRTLAVLAATDTD